MKRISLLRLIVIATPLCLGNLAHAAEVNYAGNFGLGLGLGQPLGVTTKYWISPEFAIDGMIGYHFTDIINFHADLLWHSSPLVQNDWGKFPLYLGAGARVLAGDDDQFGIRVPIGMSFLSSVDPLECFIELAPVVDLVDDVRAELDGIVGIRFYFGR